MAIPEISESLAGLEQTLSSIEQVLDVPRLRDRAKELEAEASEPNLWDDQANAQRVADDEDGQP